MGGGGGLLEELQNFGKAGDDEEGARSGRLLCNASKFAFDSEVGRKPLKGSKEGRACNPQGKSKVIRVMSSPQNKNNNRFLVIQEGTF